MVLLTNIEVFNNESNLSLSYAHVQNLGSLRNAISVKSISVILSP